jgi:hypothetical protein
MFFTGNDGISYESLSTLRHTIIALAELTAWTRFLLLANISKAQLP